MVWHAGVALFVGERESKGGKEKKKKKKTIEEISRKMEHIWRTVKGREDEG